MERSTVVLITLVLYKLLLIGIGLWAQRRVKDEADFFLGGRGLGPVVAAISYSASSSSAWTLLGLSGAAYVMGLSALWIAVGAVVGVIVAWVWIAPRMQTFSRRHNLLTLTDFVALDSAGGWRHAIVITASLIVLVSFAFYVAAQFQGAGTTFASTFDMDGSQAVILGGLIIMIYTFLGGFWAVSVTDTVQGLLMAATAILLPLAALLELGGLGAFISGLHAVSDPSQLSLSAGNAGLVAVGFIAGTLCIGLGTFGQPHLLVRFMALRDEKALRQARALSIFWFALVFFGMVALGLMGHVLMPAAGHGESVFFVLTESLFPSVIGALLLAAVLSAIMSTADSQLLVAASSVTHDLRLGYRWPGKSLLVSRCAIAGLTLLSIIVALYLPATIFNRVLFAWTALGAAFGPLVFMRLAGWRFSPAAVWSSMSLGFAVAVATYLAPDTPGDWVERCLPFLIGLALLLIFRKARSAGSGQAEPQHIGKYQ